MNADEVLRQSLQQPSIGTIPNVGSDVVSPTPIRFNSQTKQVQRGGQRRQFTAKVTPCPLKASLVTVSSTLKIQFTWGTINGQQPDGFHAGGDPSYQMDAITGYYYAYADWELSTQLCTLTGIEYNSSATLGNSSTRTRSILASLSDSLVLSSVCGPIKLSFCELDFTS